MKEYRVAVMGDSPKIQTGFGTVNKQVVDGLVEAGYDTHVYGFMDAEPDYENKLPYKFYPTSPFDQLGHQNFSSMLRVMKPHAIFIVTDPGNLYRYVYDMVNRGVADWKRDGQDYRPPVVSYTPVEGLPAPKDHGRALASVTHNLGGVACVYCHSAKEMLAQQFGDDFDVRVAYHGLDHADFRAYNAEARKLLRQMVGIDDLFMVGSVGVNKRTKGFPTLIYTARILKDMKKDKGIFFYFHCHPTQETMNGQNLLDLAEYYNVRDMILFRQFPEGSGYWTGQPYDNGTLLDVMSLGPGKIPSDPKKRGYLWANYDLISVYNCMNAYVDASQIEGWGLPLGEAMSCGVPGIAVNDRHVRQEIYSKYAHMYDPEPLELGDTWHTGMRLLKINPRTVADAIVRLRNDDELRFSLSKSGQRLPQDYRWKNGVKVIVEAIGEVIERAK